MNLKVPVRRRSCAYPLYLYDKSVQLTVVFLDFIRRSAPSSVPVIQAVTIVIKRGVIEVKTTQETVFVIFPRILSAKSSSAPAIDNATTVTFPIQEFSISASQVRIIMELGFSVSPIASG